MNRLARSLQRLDPTATLIALVLIAATLRLAFIGSQSLWLDEGFSWGWSRLPMTVLWTQAAILEPNPPLHFAALKLWTGWFGDSEAAMRALSAILSAASVGLVYAIGRLTLGHAPALLGALLAALATSLVAYGQEARGYALLSVAAGLALLGLLRFIAAATPGAGWADPDPQRLAAPANRLGSLGLYALGTVIALYTHATAVALPLLANLAVFAILPATGPGGWRRLGEWIAVNALVLVVWTGWLPALIAHAGDDGILAWLRQPSLALTGLTLLGLYGPSHLPGLAIWGPVLFALPLLALFALRPAASPRLPILLILFFVIAQPALLYLAGLVARPLLMERTLLWPVGLGFLLIAAGLLSIPWRTSRSPAIAAVLVILIVDLAFYYGATRKEPWREAVALLDREADAADIVILDPGGIDVYSLAYYGRDTSLPRPFHTIDEGTGQVRFFSLANKVVDPLFAHSDAASLRAQAADRGARLWLLVFRSSSAMRLGADRGEALAAELGPIATDHDLHPKLRIIGIDP